MTHRTIAPALLAVAAAVPVLLTLAVYGSVGRFGFVEYDDPYYVYNNPRLATDAGAAAVRYAFTTFTGGNWHPLVWLSFFADRAVWDLRPGPMHVENAALHAASGVLVLLLLADATGSLGRAAVCAAVFAVHPTHAESVAWVSERKDALSTAWLLASACGYVRWARTGRPMWYAGAVAAYALSLSAKSMGVTLPAVLLLLDGWPLGRLRRAADAWPRVREKLPWFALAAAAAVVAAIAQASVGATRALDVSAGQQLGNAAVSYVRYVAALLWPRGLAVYYPFRPVPAAAAVAAVSLLAVVTAAAVRVRRRRPYLTVGWLWFAGTLLPVSGVVQVGSQAMADRYLYFPSIGLSVAVVWLLADALAAVWWTGPAVGTSVVAALAVAGRVQAGYWRDNLTIFTRAAAVTGDNYIAYDELGREAITRGDLSTAVAYLSRAIGAKPDFATAYADLGRCALRAGRPAEAVTAYAAAVRYAPAVTAYRLGLADALDDAGRPADAADVRRRATAAAPPGE